MPQQGYPQNQPYYNNYNPYNKPNSGMENENNEENNEDTNTETEQESADAKYGSGYLPPLEVKPPPKEEEEEEIDYKKLEKECLSQAFQYSWSHEQKKCDLWITGDFHLLAKEKDKTFSFTADKEGTYRFDPLNKKADLFKLSLLGDPSDALIKICLEKHPNYCLGSEENSDNIIVTEDNTQYGKWKIERRDASSYRVKISSTKDCQGSCPLYIIYDALTNRIGLKPEPKSWYIIPKCLSQKIVALENSLFSCAK
jgi:hypothetical protein